MRYFYLILLSFFLLVSPVWSEVIPIPNCSYLQEMFDKGDLDDRIRKKLSNNISIKISGGRISNNCDIKNIILQAVYSDARTNPLDGLKVKVVYSQGQVQRLTMNARGRVSINPVTISEFPLEISVPLVNYHRSIANPINRLNCEQTLFLLDNCDSQKKSIYGALFQHLLALTNNRRLLNRVDLILRYWQQFLSRDYCSAIRDYLSDLNNNYTLKRRFLKSCPSVSDCF